MTSRLRSVLIRETPWSEVLAYVLCSALCTVMVLYRFNVTGKTTYAWLVIPNLVLAWMPYGFAQLLRIARSLGWRHPAVFAGLGALWLLFFPNAPYIVTDLIHLVYVNDGISLYFDIALIATAAWTGLGLGFSSLATVQDLVTDSFGRALGWVLVTAAWGLGAVGIYLGRVERWNSWDALRSPGSILADAAAGLRGGEPLLIMVVYAVVPLTLYLAYRARPGTEKLD